MLDQFVDRPCCSHRRLSASAAAFTKYVGVTVVPLLMVYMLMRQRRVTIHLSSACSSARSCCRFFNFGPRQSPELDCSRPPLVSRVNVNMKPGLVAQCLIGLAFVGGCLISALANFPWKNWRRCLDRFLGWLTLFVGLFAWLVPPHLKPPTAEANGSLIKMEGGIFAAIGFAIIGSAIGALVRNRQPQTLLCFGCCGIFIFATFFKLVFYFRKHFFPRFQQP